MLQVECVCVCACARACVRACVRVCGGGGGGGGAVARCDGTLALVLKGGVCVRVGGWEVGGRGCREVGAAG